MVVLRDLLTQLHEEQEQGVLFTGRGPVTTAGADTAIVDGDDDGKKRQLIDGMNDIYALLQSYPRPTVMAAKGAAVGGGFQLAVLCDFTIAGEETKLLKPEIKYGVFSGYSTTLLKDTLGRRAAQEIALRGDSIAPERALALGIVSEVVSEESVEDCARDLASQLVCHDPTAYAKTKGALEPEFDPLDFENYP